MKQYLDLLKLILTKGTLKHPTRAKSGATKNATIGLPNLHFSHNLADGFPLLTTRKLAWKGLVGELRTFLLGKSKSQDFRDNGCKFWDPWGEELGPIYGVQWNNHNQLNHVLGCLRYRTTDRRMVVSAWRPDEHHKMVLPPCHLMWVVTPYDDVLNLSWIQRSCDFPIGVPYNIASYALLTHLLATWADMTPGNISCIFCDAHIYMNQLAGVKEQLKRVPKKLPSMRIIMDYDDFNNWSCVLSNWKPSSNIDFGEVEV
jgi:thymidylate synthase